MERDIIDGNHSRDSMEIMDKLMKEELNQEEVIIRTSESKNDNDDINIDIKEGEEKNDKHKRK